MKLMAQTSLRKIEKKSGCTSDDILRLLVYSPLENKSFVPNGALDELITLDAVASTLASVGLSVGEQFCLARVIVEKGRRIFAILVFINQVSDISTFFREGFTDEMLPVAYQTEGDSWTVKSYLQTLIASNKTKFGADIVDIETINRPLECAIKELSSPDSENTFEKESNALACMRDIDHKHLIKCIAAIQREQRYFFIFPWADGGNLREFWASDESMSSNTQTISWAISQMRGLADALTELHNCNTRHGDLKPENILRFSDDSSPGFGRLVIADLGLSKKHTNATRSRHFPTRTVTGTARYEAPEAFLPDQSRSRMYDVWGLGCVFLEFVTWMLYGWTLLQTFSSLFESYARVTESGISPLDGVAQSWIEYMLLDPRCARNTALGEILNFTKKRLLVPIQDEVNAPLRASARELCDHLDAVSSQCSGNTTYLFNPSIWDELGQNDPFLFLVRMGGQLFPSRLNLSLQTKRHERVPSMPQLLTPTGGDTITLEEDLERTQQGLTSTSIGLEATAQPSEDFRTPSTPDTPTPVPVADEVQQAQPPDVMDCNSDTAVNDESTPSTVYCEVSSSDSDWSASSLDNYNSTSTPSEDATVETSQGDQMFDTLVKHTKDHIADKTPAWFLRALDSRLTLVAYQKGDTSAAGEATTSGSKHTGDNNAESPVKKKRKGIGEGSQDKGCDGGDSGGDDDRKGKGKKKPRMSASRGRQLACPFFKCDPALYGGNMTCRGHGWDTVHRIKEHLFRTHTQPEGRCPRCLVVFENLSSLQQHHRKSTPCNVVENTVDEAYIDVETTRKLRRKAVNRSAPKKSESVKWKEIFHLLFPNVHPIPSPYFHDDQERRSELELIQDFSSFAASELWLDLDASLSESGIEDTLRARIVERFQISQLEIQQKYLERQRHCHSLSIEQEIESSTEQTVATSPKEHHHRGRRHSKSVKENDTQGEGDEGDEGSLLNHRIQESGKEADERTGDGRFIQNRLSNIGVSGFFSDMTPLPPSSTGNYTAPAILQSVGSHPTYETNKNNNGAQNLSDDPSYYWPTRSSPRNMHRDFGAASDVQLGYLWTNSGQQHSSSIPTDLESTLGFSPPTARIESGAMRPSYTSWQESNTMDQLRFDRHLVVGETHARPRTEHTVDLQEASFTYSRPPNDHNVEFYDSGYSTIRPQTANQVDEANPWDDPREDYETSNILL
ncbi:hypothetical protein E0Z10_g10979 [Xylaria hypoxylon]|uniref:Protein kinase domain-containing protein n=1 Tax=Xylaria hypoxylon TaxID=37992 RepID=A0A4Z0Y7U1_9PEZI|nr:hypothetical protein E0Z10_g10979 [Xylaria hypoxylon]